MTQLCINCRVSGVSFPNKNGSSRQEVICNLAPGDALLLKREPKNEFDANAIAVLVGKKQIGYVPRQAAEILAPIMDKKSKMLCHVTSVGQAAGGKQLWGVGICITWEGDML